MTLCRLSVLAILLVAFDYLGFDGGTNVYNDLQRSPVITWILSIINLFSELGVGDAIQEIINKVGIVF